MHEYYCRGERLHGGGATAQAWVPHTTGQYRRVLGRLVRDHEVRGALVTDAQLAALAIDHGVELVSTNTDFGRFPELRWVDPLA